MAVAVLPVPSCHWIEMAVGVKLAQRANRRSSEIHGTALGKYLQAWPVYTIGPCLRVYRRVVTLLLGVH